MALTQRLLVVALVAVAGGGGWSVVAQETTELDVPTDLTSWPLVADVYGYSIEPIWLDAYINNTKTATLLGAIANVTGKPPPIRVGGNTADQTYLHPTLSTGNDSVALPSLPSANQFNITPNWYETWADYFPAGTDIIYTLNFATNESGWANAVAEAEAAYAALRDKGLIMFELGNEIDHFINKDWRDATWGVATYIPQFQNLTGQLVNSTWYREAQGGKILFQAAVFADPPWVPDQQDEIDDFSVANLTADGNGGLVERPEDRDIIGSYAMHLYPQSTCDPERWHRMRLDLLTDHLVLWQNVSQYGPQVAAAEKTGSHLVMGETNSISCSGKSGISDTLGAALWSVDYVLLGASIGVRKTYFHLGARSEYSAFTPEESYQLKNETLVGGIRPNWYSHYFVAKVVAGSGATVRGAGVADDQYTIAALPGANSSDLSGFAVYSNASTSGSKREDTQSVLKKLVFLDMGVWNGTEGLSNPSTLSAADNNSTETVSQGERPVRTLRVASLVPSSSWCVSARLMGPGTNAKSDVAVSGITFDPQTGDINTDQAVHEDTIVVGDDGVLEIQMRRAEAVLLELVDEDGTCGSSGDSGEANGSGQTRPTQVYGSGATALMQGGRPSRLVDLVVVAFIIAVAGSLL